MSEALDLVEKIISGDLVESKNIFEEIIKEKASDLIEVTKQEIFNSIDIIDYNEEE